MAVAIVPTLPNTSIGTSRDRFVPRWLRALGSLSDEMAKSAWVNSPEFSLFAKTPAGRSMRDQPMVRPSRGHRIRSHGLGARHLGLDARGGGLQLGVRLVGEGERLGQRDRDVLRLRHRGSAQGGPEAQREDDARHLHLSPPARRRRRASMRLLRVSRSGGQAVADRVADPQDGGVGDPVEDAGAVAPRLHEARVQEAREVLRDVRLRAAGLLRQLPHALLPPLQGGEEAQAPLVAERLEAGGHLGDEVRVDHGAASIHKIMRIYA